MFGNRAVEFGQAGKLPDHLIRWQFQITVADRHFCPVHQGGGAGGTDVVHLFGQHLVCPVGAAEDDLGIDRALVLGQGVANAQFDFGDLCRRILQFIDAVHEDDDVARLEVRDQANKTKVGRGQRLVCRKDHHTNPAVANRANRHLLAHQEGVVHPRCVADAHLERRVPAMQIKVGRPGDVGKPTLLAFILSIGFVQKIIAKANIAFQQVPVEIAVFMFLTQQQLEFLAQTLAGFFAHGLDLRANFLQFATGVGALRQFAQTPAFLEQAVPFVLFHQLEPRPHFFAVRAGDEMQRGHDRGPRVDIGGQQIRPAGKRVDQRGFAGLYLAKNCDRGFEFFQFQPQPRNGLCCCVTRHPLQTLERSVESLRHFRKFEQWFQADIQEVLRSNRFQLIGGRDLRHVVHFILPKWFFRVA